MVCTPVASTLHPVPQGLYPAPNGLYPRDCTQLPVACTPGACTLHPVACTLHPGAGTPGACTLASLFPDMRFPCSRRGIGAVEECTNGHKGTRGPNRTVNQNPKLHFIRRLSLQTLSHHSINTPPPKFCFSSLFSIFFFPVVRMLGELLGLFDVAPYFVHWRKKPQHSGSF